MARDLEHVAPFVEDDEGAAGLEVLEGDAPVELVLVEAGARRTAALHGDRALRPAIGQHFADAHAERILVHAGPLAVSRH